MSFIYIWFGDEKMAACLEQVHLSNRCVCIDLLHAYTSVSTMTLRQSLIGRVNTIKIKIIISFISYKTNLSIRILQLWQNVMILILLPKYANAWQIHILVRSSFTAVSVHISNINYVFSFSSTVCLMYYFLAAGRFPRDCHQPKYREFLLKLCPVRQNFKVVFWVDFWSILWSCLWYL